MNLYIYVSSLATPMLIWHTTVVFIKAFALRLLGYFLNLEPWSG